jgi:hypothetical protein
VAAPRDPWRWYSLNWLDVVGWAGEGALPEGGRIELERVVRLSREKGRRLRFYGVPNVPEVWKTGYAAGVDLMGTDTPLGLRAALAR